MKKYAHYTQDHLDIFRRTASLAPQYHSHRGQDQNSKPLLEKKVFMNILSKDKIPIEIRNWVQDSPLHPPQKVQPKIVYVEAKRVMYNNQKVQKPLESSDLSSFSESNIGPQNLKLEQEQESLSSKKSNDKKPLIECNTAQLTPKQLVLQLQQHKVSEELYENKKLMQTQKYKKPLKQYSTARDSQQRSQFGKTNQKEQRNTSNARQSIKNSTQMSQQQSLPSQIIQHTNINKKKPPVKEFFLQQQKDKKLQQVQASYKQLITLNQNNQLKRGKNQQNAEQVVQQPYVATFNFSLSHLKGKQLQQSVQKLEQNVGNLSETVGDFENILKTNKSHKKLQITKNIKIQTKKQEKNITNQFETEQIKEKNLRPKVYRNPEFQNNTTQLLCQDRQKLQENIETAQKLQKRQNLSLVEPQKAMVGSFEVFERALFPQELIREMNLQESQNQWQNQNSDAETGQNLEKKQSIQEVVEIIPQEEELQFSYSYSPSKIKKSLQKTEKSKDLIFKNQNNGVTPPNKSVSSRLNYQLYLHYKGRTMVKKTRRLRANNNQQTMIMLPYMQRKVQGEPKYIRQKVYYVKM